MARETRRDPIDVDTDRASFGWTNWDVDKDKKDRVEVKRERAVFQSLRPGTGVIDLSSPSPVRKKSKASLGASVPNPDAAELGLPHDAEECPDPTLEEELEKVMDAELDILGEELAGFHDCSLGGHCVCAIQHLRILHPLARKETPWLVADSSCHVKNT